MNFCHIGLKGSSRCRDLLEGIINLVFADINRESLDDWANSDSPWQTHPEVHRHFPSRCSLPLGLSVGALREKFLDLLRMCLFRWKTTKKCISGSSWNWSIGLYLVTKNLWWQKNKLFRDPSNIQYAVMVQPSECGRSWDAKNAATGRGLFGNPIAGAAAMWPWESKLPEVGICCPYNYGEIYPYIAEAALPSTSKKIPWFIIARHRDDDSPKCHRRPRLKRRLLETRCFRRVSPKTRRWYSRDNRRKNWGFPIEE